MIPYILLLWLLLFSAPAVAQSATHTYQKLLQDFYDAESPLCLGEQQWPVNSHTNDAPWTSGRMNALVDAGLARKARKSSKITYHLTPQGEKNWRRYGDLCYARMHVSRIEKIERTQNVSVVYFYYRLTALEGWAHNESLRFAFSELDNLLSGVDKTLYRVIISEHAGKLQDYPAPVELDY